MGLARASATFVSVQKSIASNANESIPPSGSAVVWENHVRTNKHCKNRGVLGTNPLSHSPLAHATKNRSINTLEKDRIFVLLYVPDRTISAPNKKMISHCLLSAVRESKRLTMALFSWSRVDSDCIIGSVVDLPSAWQGSIRDQQTQLE